jgi:hypothetical protein
LDSSQIWVKSALRNHLLKTRFYAFSKAQDFTAAEQRKQFVQRSLKSRSLRQTSGGAGMSVSECLYRRYPGVGFPTAHSVRRRADFSGR